MKKIEEIEKSLSLRYLKPKVVIGCSLTLGVVIKKFKNYWLLE